MSTTHNKVKWSIAVELGHKCPGQFKQKGLIRHVPDIVKTLLKIPCVKHEQISVKQRQSGLPRFTTQGLRKKGEKN